MSAGLRRITALSAVPSEGSEDGSLFPPSFGLETFTTSLILVGRPDPALLGRNAAALSFSKAFLKHLEPARRSSASQGVAHMVSVTAPATREISRAPGSSQSRPGSRKWSRLMTFGGGRSARKKSMHLSKQASRRGVTAPSTAEASGRHQCLCALLNQFRNRATRRSSETDPTAERVGRF